ncbi:hypothetical protein JCM11251_002672 [Rhodosporidiobolus azoricus]
MPHTEGGVRRRVNAFFRKHFVPSSSSSSPSTPPGASSPAHSSPSISRRSTNHGHEIPQLRSHHPPGGISVADRPVGQSRGSGMGNGNGTGTGTRRRRRRRRTTSPVGLPLYSKDPGEEEMSLFKSEIDLSLSDYPSRVGEEDEEEIGSSESEAEEEEDDDGEDELRGRPSRDFDPSLHVRPSFDASTEEGSAIPRPSFQTTTGGLVPPPSINVLQNRPRSASAPLAHLSVSASPPQLARYLSNSPGSSSPFASRSGLIDLPVNQLETGSPGSPVDTRPSTPTASRPPVSLRGTWGYSSSNSPYTHRPYYSSPINTLAPPLSSSPSNGIGLGRPRSSTLQRMFASSRNASNVSLSAAFADPASAGRSPYGQFGGGGASGSTARLASASSSSITTRDISAPLPNSFVHSSFIFPRSGPTAAQVAFISSRESLGAYGYGAGVAQEAPFAHPPTFEAATSTLSLALPTGAVGSSEGGSGSRPGAVPVQGRGRSASSASRMSDLRSSPLARVETSTPSPPPSPPLAALLPEPSTRRRPDKAAEQEEIKMVAPASSTAATTHATTGHHRPSLSLDLPLLSTLPSLPSFASSPTDASPPPTPSPAPTAPQTLLDRRRRRSSTASTASTDDAQPPRPPPQIGILAPTPTASAAPSPLLPNEGSYFDLPQAARTTTSISAAAAAASTMENEATSVVPSVVLVKREEARVIA